MLGRKREGGREEGGWRRISELMRKQKYKYMYGRSVHAAVHTQRDGTIL